MFITLIANGTPIVNPHVELQGTGRYLDFQLTVAADQYLVLDFATKRALLNGQASRSNTLRRPGSRWFQLAPGPQTLRVNVTGAAQAWVTFRPAWFS